MSKELAEGAGLDDDEFNEAGRCPRPEAGLQQKKKPGSASEAEQVKKATRSNSEVFLELTNFS